MNDDLISREALKKALEVTQYNDIDDLTRTERLIDNAPTVDAYPFEQVQELVKLNQQFAEEIENLKRPQGEWVICNQDNEGIHKIECPFCKCVKGSDFGGLITLTFDRFPPFCENCGADMRGKERE